MLSPGTAYLLAYLPARRLGHTARKELLERNATTIDAALKQALEFARHALKVEDSMVGESDQRATQLAAQAGLASPDAGRAALSSSVLKAAWNAGESAGRVSMAVRTAAQLAHLRNAAPDNSDLRTQAETYAKELKAAADQLTADLTATGLPLVISQASNVAKMISLTRDLTPASPGGYRQLNELVRDLESFIDTKVRQLDTAPPEPPSSAASGEEQALFAKILANPSDLRLRNQLVPLADARGDDRGRLIRLQLGVDDTGSDLELIRSHPEWTSRLQQLGATDIKFAAGFPDDIKIDAASFLSNGKELLAAAPLRRLRIRNAQGKVGEIVRSPLLATIETLDLDAQGVTDDDVIALAASPHAARLRQLDLRHNPLTERGIEAIAASPRLKQLELAHFDGNAADPTDRQEYRDEVNFEYVPTAAGKALEAKYGPLRWLRRF